MTLAQLIERTQNQLNDKLTARNGAADNLASLRDAETPSEEAVQTARATLRGLDNEVDTLAAQLREYKDEAERDDAVRRLQAQTAPTDAGQRGSGDEHQERSGRTASTQVGQEPRTYSAHSNTRSDGFSFFSDAYAYSRGNRDNASAQRLMRHAKEVEVHGEMTERATSTGSFAGLVVPQYLVDEAALVLRKGRPLANVIRRLQIPAQGMSFVIPRGTTGASAAVQSSENSAVSSTDEVWANLTVPVVTIAGAQDVSRQSLERGAGVDALIYTDLVGAYAEQIGSQIINGTGSGGQMLGIMNTAGIGAATAFGAAAGAANFSLKVAGANTSVYSGGIGLAPELLVVHPRRWGWLTGLVDTTNRPIVQANTNVAFNTIATGGYGPEDLAIAQTPFVGVHNSGLPVLLDLNIPTTVGTLNEDVLLSVDPDQLLLWEDGDGMPRQLSFEQTSGGNLTTKLVVYNYAAFTAGRYPGAVAKVGGVDTVAGNGLIAPTF